MKEQCLCGKRVYGTLEVANAAAVDYETDNPSKKMNGYECKMVPGNFHIGTSTPSKIVSFYDIPKSNMLILRHPQVSYLMVSKQSLSLDAYKINKLLNENMALLIGRTAGPKREWEYLSPSCSVVADMKVRTLMLEIWAAAKIKNPKSRIPWVKKTYEYLLSTYRRTTKEMVEEFIGWKPEEIEITPSPIIKEITAMPEPAQKFFMTEMCKVQASNPRAKTIYRYHTDEKCWAMLRGGSTSIVTLDSVTDKELIDRMKICSVCSGTFKQKMSTRTRRPHDDITYHPPTVQLVLPISLDDVISINNVIYHRADTIKAERPEVVGEVKLEGEVYYIIRKEVKNHEPI